MKNQFLKIVTITVFTTNFCLSQGIGYDITPNISYRKSIDNGAYSGLKASVDNLEIPAVRFSTSLKYYFPKINKLQFFTSLGYSSVGDKDLTKRGDDLTVNDSTDPSIPYKYFFSRHFNFLDIGGGVNYYLVDNSLQVFISSSLKGNIPLSGQSKFHKIDQSGNRTTTNVQSIMPNFNANVSIGIGLGYNVGLITVYVKPQFTQMLFPIFSNTVPLDRRYYDFGSSFGVIYAL